MNSLHLQQSGIEQVIERYQEPLYWHIRRMVVSHEDAEDVLQETFIKIFQHYGALQKGESERAWAYRIATNEALQWLRSKHEMVYIDDEESEVGPLLDTLLTDSYTETCDALLLRFQEAILRLPTMQRTVFNLRYYDELSYEEIAAITGSTAASAKANYHLAKTKISAIISGNM